MNFFFFSSRRRHTISYGDWSSDVCSSDLGLANGCSGYLPPPDQFALGGYSTWRARSSYLETGAEPKIVTTLNELLQQVRSRRIAQGSMTLPPERRPPARRLRTSPNQKRPVGDRRSATLFPFCWQCHAPIA